MDIIQWNINGFRTRLSDIQMLVSRHSPSILCLQETKLRHHHALHLNQYFTFRYDHPTGIQANGGAAVLVKNSLHACQVPLQTPLQAVALRISLSSVVLTICNVYLPPDADVSDNDITSLIKQLPPPFIFLGDMNAHHSLWGSEVDEADARGNMLADICDRHMLITLNTGEPTYLSSSHGTFSAVDVSVCSRSLSPSLEWSVSSDLWGSDHFPINIHLECTHSTAIQVPYWNLKRANWSLYSHDVHVEDFNFETVDAMVTHFNNSVLCAAKAHVPLCSTRNRRQTVPWWTDECREAIGARKKALVVFSRHPTEENLINFKRLRSVARRVINTAKRASWKRYVSSLSKKTPTTQVWQKLRRMCGKCERSPIPGLLANGAILTSQEDIANTLASSFQEVSSTDRYDPEFLSVKVKAERTHLNFNSMGNQPYNAPFSLVELEGTLGTLKDTAPGPDGIHNKMLYHLPIKAKEFLLSLFNKIWQEHVFPTLWQEGTIIPIPKPGKDRSLPSSYRPICLTSCVCKLLERMVNRRLAWYLEKGQHLSNMQCGFRRHRSTIDHLINLEAYIQNAFLLKQHVTAVFFDLEKAYDTAWRFGILRTLYQWGYRGHLPIFISNFLAHRTFKVRVGGTFSQSHVQENGVPQGSVLSVTLFTIAINSIVSSLPATLPCSLYVDDFAIYYRSQNLQHIERQLQVGLNGLFRWSRETGFNFSATKTVCIHFTRLRGIFPPPDLYLNGTALPFAESTKFLGLTLDHKLSWEPHIRQLRSLCDKALNVLRALTSSSWGGDRTVMLRLYRSLVRSKLDYGSVVYGSAPLSKLRLLDTVHHAGIRLSTGAFRTSRVESLYAECGEPSLALRRDILLLAYSARLAVNPQIPSYNALFRPRLRHRYELNRKISRPAGIRLSQCLTTYGVSFENLIGCAVPKTPPWLIPRAVFDMSLTTYSKRSTSPGIYHQLFSELLARYPGFTEVYTDGSSINGTTGCAFVIGELSNGYRLHPYTTVFSAELYAILKALEYVKSLGPGSFLFCIDSLSAVQSLHSFEATHPLTCRIQSSITALLSRGYQLVFCWTPGHIGLPGNDKADSAAKDSTSNLETYCSAVYVPDMQVALRRSVFQSWQNAWAVSFDNKLRTVKDSVLPWRTSSRPSRREEVILTRLRIGHCRLTHRHLLAGNPPPVCTLCGDDLSVAHILITCPSLADIRLQVDLKLHLQTILSNDETEVRKIFVFLSLSRLLQSI